MRLRLTRLRKRLTHLRLRLRPPPLARGSFVNDLARGGATAIGAREIAISGGGGRYADLLAGRRKVAISGGRCMRPASAIFV